MRYLITFIILFCPATVLGDLTSSEMKNLRDVEIIILGEVHDNPAHHLGQAGLIAEIDPTSVVFEMLSPEMAVAASTFTGPLPELGAAIGWEEAGWPDFAMYLPVFEALDDAVIMGAAAPRDFVRAAFSKGAAEVFGEDAPRFGLTVALPAEQAEQRAAFQFAAHCEAMPREMMGGMVEAQRFRDAIFANAALKALETHGSPVVVITGHGHARRDWGIPFMITQADPDVMVFSVGFMETPAREDDPRFDATVVTAAAERADPCAVFRN